MNAKLRGLGAAVVAALLAATPFSAQAWAESVDTTPPSVFWFTQPRFPDGDNGWFVSDVYLTWMIIENDSPASITLDECELQAIEADRAEAAYSCTASSDGGTSETVTTTLKRDATPPTAAVTGVADGANYDLGSVPTGGCTATDNLSGIAVGSTATITGGTANGTGTFTVTCSAPRDQAGNVGAQASATYSVGYSGGEIASINADNTTVFNRTQAVPVKFSLAGDEFTGFDTSGWTVSRQLVSCTTFAAAGPSESVNSKKASHPFRYDANTDQYTFNADLTSATSGACYTLQVHLDNGQVLTSAAFQVVK